jgi:hypothetical protein
MPTLTLIDPIAASPSTPSDISYDTIQDIRSPSPYQWKTTCLGGVNAATEGNTARHTFLHRQSLATVVPRMLSLKFSQ